MDFNNDDNEDFTCDVMYQLKTQKKYKEATEHVLSLCVNCIANPKRKFLGREMLYANAPPPWIKIPEEEKTNPRAWEKYKKKKISSAMSPEEIDKYLIESDFGDEKMVSEITKFKRVDRVEAWKVMREIRKKQLEIQRIAEKERKLEARKKMEEKREMDKLKKADERRKSNEVKQAKTEQKSEYLEKMSEEQKELEDILGDEDSEQEKNDDEDEYPKKKEATFNLRNQMPWAPSTFDVLCKSSNSELDHETQKRICAMVQNKMYHGSTQHLTNKRELRDLRNKVEHEYDTLVAAALQWASEQTVFPLDYLYQLGKTIYTKMRRRVPTDNHYMFSTPVITIDMTTTDLDMTVTSEANAILPELVTLLQKGWADQLRIPDVTKKVELNKKLKSPLPWKLPINSDPTARHLTLNSPSVSMMMDATTLCHLMTPNWESRSYSYGIPLTVSEEMVNGKMKKIIVLSKPFQCNSITRATLQRRVAKNIFQRQFIVENEKNSTFDYKATLAHLDHEKEKQNEESSIPGNGASSQETLDDPLESIFSDINRLEKTAKDKSKTGNQSIIETGKQYSIFRIGSLEVLIRSKPAMKLTYEGSKTHSYLSNKTVSFEPRIEYLPSGGAMDMGVEEWSWNYLKQLFRHSKAHILFRTNYKLDNLLQVDALTMSEYSEKPPGALALISVRTLIVEKFLANLDELSPGEYLAYQENDKPMKVVPKCESDVGVSSKLMEIKDESIEMLAGKIGDNYFHGFSPDVVFQWQIVQGRAPRMLLAKDSPVIDHLPAKTDIRKMENHQKSFKRKFKQKEHQRNETKRQKMIDLDDPNLSIDFSNPGMLNSPVGNTRSPISQYSERGGRGRFRGGRGRGRGRRSRGASDK